MTHALACARLSQEIYEDSLPLLRDKLAFVYPFHQVDIIMNDGCEVVCLASEGNVMIAFRGSEFDTRNDFLANLDVMRDPDYLLDDVQVHGGYLQEVASVWPRIVQFIERYAKAEYAQVVVTGHSLGGALALLCSARIRRVYDLLPVVCYTFGAPMLGGSTFAEFFAKNRMVHYRFVNNNDMVPTLKTLRFLGYEHVGTKLYFNYQGHLINRVQTRWERFQDWFYGHWDAVKNLEFGDSFRDHTIARYVQILEQLCEQEIEES